MNVEQQEREWQSLEQDTHTIAAFVSSLDTMRLRMMSNAITEELSWRSQGKPCDSARLH